ncbi:MAG: ArsR/SmtB family transcription factor [Planctomycetaceae bacterium]
MTSQTLEVPAEKESPALSELNSHLEGSLVGMFKLLADETRLRILFFLGQAGELHVTALCARLRQSQPAVSHHLALLREAGLIEARRDGKHNYYSIRMEHLDGLMERLVSVFGDRGLLNLGRFTLTQSDS